MPIYNIRINGRAHQIEGDAKDDLLSIIRYDLGLTGSKFGCGEGHCGACTVLIDGQAARSCVIPIGSAAGKSITTIEAIGEGDELHPVQAAFLEAEAFQCGYCTPGMVMATIGLLKDTPNPSDQDIARLMDRNVCRCGSYARIVRAVRIAADRMKSTPPGLPGARSVRAGVEAGGRR
jgi:nicotinate dehydrogenase subunit A